MDLDMSEKDPRTEHQSLMTCTKNMILLVNLKKSLDDKTLRESLETYGELQWCQMIKSPSGTPHGFAFAKYYNKEAAEYIIKNVPTLPAEKEKQPIRIVMSTLRADSRFCDSGKFYMTGVAEHVTEQNIKEILQNCVPYFGLKKASKDSFVIHVLTELHLEPLLDKMKEKKYMTSKFEVRHHDEVFSAIPSGKQRLVLRPFNLDPSVDSNQLSNMFNFLGRIKARVLKDAYGKSRRQGYIIMNKPTYDTPLFSLFKELRMENGDIRLQLNIGNSLPFKSFQLREYKNAIQTMFYPSAQPPIQHMYYRVPHDSRRNIKARIFFENKKDTSENFKILLCYNVHVSNIGTHTRQTLLKLFQKYGTITYTVVIEGDNPWGIVSFKNMADASKAVADFNVKRKNETTKMFAGLMDCFQLHYWNERQAILHRLQKSGSLEMLRRAEFPMYNDFIHQFTDDGNVKRFTKANYVAVTKFRYTALAEEVDRGFEELNKSSSDESHSHAGGSIVTQETSSEQNLIDNNQPSVSNLSPSEVQAIETEAEEVLNNDEISARLKAFFSKRTQEDISELMATLRAMPPADLNVLQNDDDALRLFCLKYLIAKARGDSPKNQ